MRTGMLSRHVSHALHQIHRTHCASPLKLAAVCFLLVASFLPAPLVATAAPTSVTLIKKVSSFDKSLKQGVSSAKISFTTRKSVTASIRVTTLDGRLVYEKKPVSVKKNAKKKLSWDGRAGSTNQIELKSKDFVKPGTYRVTLSLKKGEGYFQNISKKVKVSNGGKQKIKQIAVDSSIYLSPSGSPGSYSAVIKLKKKADVTIEVIDPKTGAILASKIYRKRPCNKNTTVKWNGRFTISESMEIEPGVFSKAGNPVPVGTYTVRISSNNAVVNKKIKVLLAPKLAWECRTDCWVFPLNTKSNKGGAGSKFGSKRSGGRNHAGVDLLAPSGSPVYAMCDGVVQEVMRGNLYAGTGAVQIRHTDGIVIRYGEIKPGSKIKKGVRVSQNQRIGSVQRSSAGSSMLHLESYAGTSSGKLTQRSACIRYLHVKSKSYMRRKDIFNPTGVALLQIPAGR